MFRILVIPFLLFSGSTVAADAPLSASDTEFLTKQIQEKMEGRPAFQGSALLMQGTEVLWHYQQGSTSQGKPFDQHSVFFVGSISKTLAAVLVMQQV